jgi:hypothetical protein
VRGIWHEEVINLLKSCNFVSTWGKVLLQDLIIAQVVKVPPFVKLTNWLPCSQEPATSPYPEPDESTPHPHVMFPEGVFHYYLHV